MLIPVFCLLLICFVVLGIVISMLYKVDDVWFSAILVSPRRLLKTPSDLSDLC